MRLMKRSPSSMSWAALPREPRGIGGMRRKNMTTDITKNPAPEIKRAASVLMKSMMNPATAGAIIRVLCQITEFIATALIMTLRSIKWGYMA